MVTIELTLEDESGLTDSAIEAQLREQHTDRVQSIDVHREED